MTYLQNNLNAISPFDKLRNREDGMVGRMFSVTYVACLQNKVSEEIKSGDLEGALKTLESLPNATTLLDKLQRLIVMCEGYKAIVRGYIKPGENINDKEEHQENAEIEELVSILRHI